MIYIYIYIERERERERWNGREGEGVSCEGRRGQMEREKMRAGARKGVSVGERVEEIGEVAKKKKKTIREGKKRKERRKTDIYEDDTDEREIGGCPSRLLY